MNETKPTSKFDFLSDWRVVLSIVGVAGLTIMSVVYSVVAGGCELDFKSYDLNCRHWEDHEHEAKPAEEDKGETGNHP